MSKNLFPDDKVIVTEYFDVHQDWEVPIEGFLIMAIKRKVKSILEFNEGEAKEFMPLLLKVRKALKDVLNIEEVIFFQNEATQHKLFHIWLFPHHPWMKDFGYKVEAIRPIIEYAKEHMSDAENITKVKAAAERLREGLK